MSFFAELKRRNVFRVGIAYAVAAWIILQVFDVVGEILELPAWGGKMILALVVVGFFLALLFAWAYELTPEGVKREAEVDRSRSIAPQTGRKLDRTIMVLLVLGMTYFIWESRFMERRDEPGPPVETTAQAAAEPEGTGSAAPAEEGADGADQNSIAVLPFVNMSADPDNEYFSDGLTETLLHMLAQLPELRVAARTSSFSFKGKDTSIGEVAKALNVAHVLEGSVQKAGNQVRVTAQLIRAEDGFHLWSQNYTRPLEDIFAIQDEIATDVADALGASLLGPGENVIEGPATRNLDAYEVYLKALDEQATFSYASLETAEGLFKQALVLDPEFRDARLGLVRNHLLMKMTGLIDHAEAIARVEPLLAQVRANHPDNPQARAYELVLRTEFPEVIDELSAEERRAAMNELRGLLAVIPDEWLVRWRVSMMVEWFDNDEQGALDVLQAGLLVDPRSSFLYARIGDLLRDMGRLDEAEAALERAVELDPEQPGVYTRLARLAAARNDLPGRIRWMRRAVEADPQDHELAASLAADFYELGLTEEGDRWAQRVAALVPGSDFERLLAVSRAESEKDWGQVMALARAMMEGGATQREGIFPRAVGAYAHAATQLGKAKEAYDFILSLRPGAADYAQPAEDVGIMDLRMPALFLMTEFADRETIVSAWIHAAEQAQDFGWNWEENPNLRLFDHVIRGEYEAAVPEALEVLSRPLAQNPQQREAFEQSFMAPVASDPAVAARLAELDREYEDMRTAVVEMTQDPEWQ